MTRWQWALWAACIATELVALVGAALLTRRGEKLRPIVVIFAAALFVDLTVRALEALVVERAARLAGGALAAFYACDALVMAWPAALAALAWWTFQGPQKANGSGVTEPRASRSPTPPLTSVQTATGIVARGSLAVKLIFAAWTAAVAYLVFRVPLSQAPIQRALHAVELGVVAIGWLAALLGWGRRRERPAVVALALLAAETAIAIVGPYAKQNPWDPAGDWDVARWGYLVAFGAIAGLQIRWLRSAQR